MSNISLISLCILAGNPFLGQLILQIAYGLAFDHPSHFIRTQRLVLHQGTRELPSPHQNAPR